MFGGDHHAERDGYFDTPAVASRLEDECEGGIRRAKWDAAQLPVKYKLPLFLASLPI